MSENKSQNGYIIEYVTKDNKAGIALVSATSVKEAEGILNRQGVYSSVGYEIATVIPLFSNVCLNQEKTNSVLGEVVTAKGEKGDKGNNGSNGHSPYISDGYWYYYDDETKDWIKGNKAQGEPGKDGKPGSLDFSNIPVITLTPTNKKWTANVDWETLKTSLFFTSRLTTHPSSSDPLTTWMRDFEGKTGPTAQTDSILIKTITDYHSEFSVTYSSIRLYKDGSYNQTTSLLMGQSNFINVKDLLIDKAYKAVNKSKNVFWTLDGEVLSVYQQTNLTIFVKYKWKDTSTTTPTIKTYIQRLGFVDRGTLYGYTWIDGGGQTWEVGVDTDIPEDVKQYFDIK